MSQRIFVCVEIPRDIQERIRQHLQFITASEPGVRSVPADSFHVTMRFLGELDSEEVACVVAAAKMAARGVERFKISIEGMDAFPNTARARVIWAGVSLGSDELNNLRHRLDHNLAEAGFPPEREPYLPHVTLARVRPNGPRDVVRNVKRILNSFSEDEQASRSPEFMADSVTVMSSVLGPRGSTYTPIERIPLGP